MFYKYIAPALCALTIFFGSCAIACASGTPTIYTAETSHVDGTSLFISFYGKSQRNADVYFTFENGDLTNHGPCKVHLCMDGIIIADLYGNRVLSLTHVKGDTYTYNYQGETYGLIFTQR